MKYNYDVKMSYTDNPYIDLLVYYTKFMGLNCVVKNEREALKYETLESRQESNKLIAFKQGVHLKEPFYEENYEEKNNYYRRLNGLPPLPSSEEEEAYIKKYGYDSVDPLTGHVKALLEYAYIPMEQYQYLVPEDSFLDFTGRFFHELSSTELKMIEQYGIIDMIRDTYTSVDYEYIYHMDEMRIDPYVARTAENFSLLFCPSIPFIEIEEKFKRTFDRNRLFTTTSIYSEAFTYGSVHYDNFIQILIILQTMIDLISEVQEYIINKDVFDSRTIRYLFESYGIAYYKEIDVKYQLRIIKNVNQLLKFKSTNINIQDIVDIFDNPDIDIFTYYLMKTKRVPKESFNFYTNEDINPKYSEGKIYYISEDKMTNNRYPLLNVPVDSNDSDFKSKVSGILVSEIMKYYEILPYDTGSFKSVRMKVDSYLSQISSSNNIYMNQYYYQEIKSSLFNIMNGQNIIKDYPISNDKLIEVIDKALPYTSHAVGWINMGDARSLIPTGESVVKVGMEIVTKPNIPIYNEAEIYQIVTEDMVGTEKFIDNYNLCFLRVPISEPNASAYIEDTSCRRNYDYITNQDPFWDGVSKADILTEEEKARYHKEKREEILMKDFTIERTKYISVDAAVDVTKMSYQLSYFMNILYDKHIDEELLQLEVDPRLSSSKVKLSDLFAFATALNYLYNGVEPDMIAADMERNMTINGFNFDTDWVAIYNELNNRHHIYNEQLQPMMKGELVEFTDQQLSDLKKDIIPIIEPNNGAFLSGRYGKCQCTDKDPNQIGYSVIWERLKRNKVIDIYENYSDYTWNGWEGYSYPSYLEPYLHETGDTSIFGEHTIIDPITGEECKGYDENGYLCHYVDLTWDTPYGDEENSHANFMNTDIFNTMNNDKYTDLQRFNKLKEIYYTNTDLYDHLTYMMRTAESKRMYDIYHTLFESFMETTLCHEFYNIYDASGNLVYEDSKGRLYKYSIKDEHYELESGHKVYYDSNKNRYVYRNNNGEHEFYCSSTNTSVPVVKDSYGNPAVDAENSYVPNVYGLYPYYQQEVVYISNDGTIVETVYDEETGQYIPTVDDIKPKMAKDYYEFLQHRNVDLYNHLMDVANSYTNKDEQKSVIMTLCSYVASALERYFDSKEWKYIYNQIPSHNLQFIQQCILKVVIFFKSWKTQMLDQTVSYIIDDPYQNHVHILDDMFMSSKYRLYEKIRPRDFHDFLIHKVIRDKVEIGEKFDLLTVIFEPVITYLNMYEKISPMDYHSFVTITQYSDYISPKDKVDINIWYDLYVGTEEDFIYYIDNGEVTLVRYIGNHTALKVPETLEGYPVVTIDEPCFSYTNFVTLVKIPEGIKYIN